MKLKKMLLIGLLTTCTSISACEWQEPLGGAFINPNEKDSEITACDNLQYIKHNSQDETYYCAKDETVCETLKEKFENIQCSLWNESPCNGFDTQMIDKQTINNFEYAFKYNKCTINHPECPNKKHNIESDNYCQNKEIVKCAERQTICKDENGKVSCLNPSSNETCGATCDNPDGTSCDTDKNLSCQQDGSSEAYKCQCFSGFVDCDGQCLDPKNDKNHCGSPTNSCAELKKCDDAQICNDGQCTCNPGTYLCDGQCKSPNQKETCGINEKCKSKLCEKNETCAITGDGYQCQLTSCDDGYNLCSTHEGRKCVSENDPDHCGGCNIQCKNQLPANAINPTCNNAQCDFECETGYLKCDGRCVAIDSNNCGSCGNRCIDGNKCSFKPQEPPEKAQCIQSTCTGENEGKCEATTGSSLVCIGENNACGSDCIDCTAKFGNASTCINNRCSFTCKDGQHPIFSTDGIMLDCENNINTACGSKDMKFEDELVNCIKFHNEKNAISSQCVDNKCRYICDEANHLVWSDSENKCVCKNNYYPDNNNFCKPYITTCPKGQHVSQDRKSCVQNSPNACAPTIWDGNGEYSDYVKDCGNTNFCHNNGTCCSDNYSTNAINVCLPNYCPNVNRDHITKMENNCFVHECNNNYDVNNQENNNGCTCNAPKTDCDDFCVDLNTDTNNCGECGNECQQGESCIYGSCQSIIQCNNNNCNDCNNNRGKYCKLRNENKYRICTEELNNGSVKIKCLDIIDCKDKTENDICENCYNKWHRECLRKSIDRNNNVIYVHGQCQERNVCLYE